MLKMAELKESLYTAGIGAKPWKKNQNISSVTEQRRIEVSVDEVLNAIAEGRDVDVEYAEQVTEESSPGLWMNSRDYSLSIKISSVRYVCRSRAIRSSGFTTGHFFGVLNTCVKIV